MDLRERVRDELGVLLRVHSVQEYDQRNRDIDISADRLLSIMGEDARRLDWLADGRAIDGIGTNDIHDAACRLFDYDATDDEITIAYRKALRDAIDAAMLSSEARNGK